MHHAEPVKPLTDMPATQSSSLALADTDGPAVRDHRNPYQQPAPGFGWRRPVVQRPVLLADNARVSGWSMIDVSAQTRMFSKLELKANSGHTDLDRVLITFANGQRQVVSLRGKLDGKITAGKSLTIDLEGGARNTKSVMLIGSSGRRGSIDILAV